MKMVIQYLKNDQALSSFLSVMIFVAITILLVIVVMLFQTGILSDAPQKLIPSIGMIQDGDHILIASVQNGPVIYTTVSVEIINKSSGQIEGSAFLNDGGNGEIDVGDSIIFTNITNGAYTVSLLYEGIVVGHCQYARYKN
jgi:hypothetical protein